MEKQSFFFVDGLPSSNGERKLGARQARAHTARINKSKRDKLMYCSAVDAGGSQRSSPSRKSTPVSEERSSNAELQCWNAKECWIGLTPMSEEDHRKQARNRGESAHSLCARSSEEFGDKDTALVQLRRTISPFLGAPTTNTFTLGHSDKDVASTADYCMLDSVKQVNSARYLRIPRDQCYLAKHLPTRQRDLGLVRGLLRMPVNIPLDELDHRGAPRPLLQQA